MDEWLRSTLSEFWSCVFDVVSQVCISTITAASHKSAIRVCLLAFFS